MEHLSPDETGITLSFPKWRTALVHQIKCDWTPWLKWVACRSLACVVTQSGVGRLNDWTNAPRADEIRTRIQKKKFICQLITCAQYEGTETLNNIWQTLNTEFGVSSCIISHAITSIALQLLTHSTTNSLHNMRLINKTEHWAVTDITTILPTVAGEGIGSHSLLCTSHIKMNNSANAVNLVKCNWAKTYRILVAIHISFFIWICTHKKSGKAA